MVDLDDSGFDSDSDYGGQNDQGQQQLLHVTPQL
jgi:hypothetical protein